MRMRIPSEDLAAKNEYIARNVGGVKVSDKIKKFSDSKERAKLKRVLKTLRNTVYEMIQRHFVFVDEYGVWLAVSEEAVKHAMRVTEYIRERLKEIKDGLRKLGKIVDIEYYEVTAYPVYLEVDEARRLLNAAYRKLLREVDKLQESINRAEMEKKREYLRKLERKKEYKEALLESLKQLLAQL